jgi:TolA-binding protein
VANPETARQPEEAGAGRASLVEDRAARKLVEAGELRLAAGEESKAVEIWESCLERYPKSRVRFEARKRLGDYFLEKKRAYDTARQHFEAAASEENPDEGQRAAARLKTGVCYHEARNFGASFKCLREVIDKFPGSEAVNDAYYYLGLGHYKLGHFSRAIENLEKVGAGFSSQDATRQKLEAGRRLYLRVDDADLAVLEEGQSISAAVKSASGDEETVNCLPLGRRNRVVMGSLPTALGKPQKGNGRLEIKGGDTVTVRYLDEQTAAEKAAPREYTIKVVGDAAAAIKDGSFSDAVQGVVAGKAAHFEVADADGDVSDAADSLKARVEVFRAKTPEEIETETAAAQAQGAAGAPVPKIDPLRRLSEQEISLTESSGPDGTAHTGVFRGSLVVTAQAAPGKLDARPGDLVRLSYQDEFHTGSGARTVTSEARCVEGHLGEVTVAKSQISDTELRIRTLLKTADALTHVGNFYKEFGIEEKAAAKFTEALQIAEEATAQAAKSLTAAKEECYVQLWRIYFAMEMLDPALAVSERLQAEFPASAFIDEAIFQQAQVARKKKDPGRAVALFTSLLRLQKSPLRGEAQYALGECYEEMAAAAAKEQAAELFERAFQAYHDVYEKFPDHPRVGDAVAKMANFYYQNKDYARAIDVFETVLKEHPDANFLDVILFNYGRCLYRLEKKAQARKQFDQLIQEYPDSPLAEESRKISDTLAKAGY